MTTMSFMYGWTIRHTHREIIWPKMRVLMLVALLDQNMVALKGICGTLYNSAKEECNGMPIIQHPEC